MDGVTDAAMRHITAKYGHPDFMVTEFTSAEGLIRGVNRLLRDFYYLPDDRPIIAQIFGTDPAAFYACSVICCALGFDGVDINMGCHADTVAKRGAGAALILTPELAKDLVKVVKKGISDWQNGISLDDLHLDSQFINQIKASSNYTENRRGLPVSIKTRIGYNKVVTTDWISTLLETEPDLITVHGRTLSQHYGGQASWEEIGKAADLTHQTNTLIFGNGDLTTPESIATHTREYRVDGAWIGRAAMGNPWIFSQYQEYVASGTYTPVTKQQRLDVALEHTQAFNHLNETVFAADPMPFLNIRKHLGWYIKGFPQASELRAALFQTNCLQDVQKALAQVIPAP